GGICAIAPLGGVRARRFGLDVGSRGRACRLSPQVRDTSTLPAVLFHPDALNHRWSPAPIGAHPEFVESQPRRRLLAGAAGLHRLVGGPPILACAAVNRS